MAVEFSSVEMPITVPGGPQALAVLEKLDQRATLLNRGLTTGTAEAAAGVETLMAKLEHVGVQGSFAITSLAEGGEMGLTRFAHSIALFGDAFGPAGLLVTTFVGVAGEKLIQWFLHAQKEADDTRDKFLKDVGEMANAGDFAKLRKSAQDLLYGTPFDEKGNFVGNSTRVANAFKGSLADMEAEFTELSQKIPRGAEFVSGEVGKRYNELVPKLNEARKAFKELQLAENNLANQPAGNAGELPAAKSSAPSTDAIVKRYREQAEAIRAIQEEQTRKFQEWVKEHSGDQSFAVDREKRKNDLDEELFYLDIAQQAYEEKERRRREMDLEHQRQIAEKTKQLASQTGEAISATMSGLLHGGIGGGFQALTKSILEQMGHMFIQMGEQLIAASSLIKMAAQALLSFSGEGSLIAGVGLIALGSALVSAGGSGGGASGGGGSAYTPDYSRSAITATVTPRYAAPNTAGVHAAAPVTNHFLVIGPDDPRAQRAIARMVKKSSGRVV